MDGQNDEEAKNLIASAKAGDEAAFGRLYDDFFVPVYRYIFLRLKNKAAAEDICQDVFLRAFAAMERFEERGRPFLAFLLSIARNAVFDFWKEKKEILIDDFVLENNLGLANRSGIDDWEINFELAAVLEKLSEEKREAIILKYYSGLSSEEIGGLLGKKAEAIRQTQHRALIELRDIMKM